MARGTRTVYPGEWNKGLTSTFQPPEEGRSVQRPKRCDKHGNKDEDNPIYQPLHSGRIWHKVNF